MEFKLGIVIRDRISGFKGVAVSRVEFMNGCVRYLIEPTQLKDGNIIESRYFDVEQLEVVDEASPMLKPSLLSRAVKAVGGPHDAPTRNSDPR